MPKRKRPTRCTCGELECNRCDPPRVPGGRFSIKGVEWELIIDQSPFWLARIVGGIEERVVYLP